MYTAGAPDKKPKDAEQDGAEAAHQKYALEGTQTVSEATSLPKPMREKITNSRNVTRKITKVALKNRTDIRLFYCTCLKL